LTAYHAARKSTVAATEAAEQQVENAPPAEPLVGSGKSAPFDRLRAQLAQP
jgi:hypothetical protein